jgi:cytochrome c-type protein NapB
MIKQTIITIATLGLLSVTASAVNTSACAGCHGADFSKSALGKSKIVKDMSKADIETALNGYKDGSYGGAMKGIMTGQVAKLSKEDITAIATSIAGGDDAKAEDANKTADANTTATTDANKTAPADANKTSDANKTEAK